MKQNKLNMSELCASKAFFVALLFGFAFLVLGCVKPKSVKLFAKTSKETMNSFPSIARDLNDSCVRRLSYKKKGELFKKIIQPGTKLSVLFNRKFSLKMDLKKCKTANNNTKALLALHATLKTYVQLLEDVASAKPPAFASDGLKDILKAAKLKEKQTEAISALAGFLYNAAVDGYRNFKLSKAIPSAEKALPSIFEAVEKVLGKEEQRVGNQTKKASGYIRLVQNEIASLANMYRMMVLHIKKSPQTLNEVDAIQRLHAAYLTQREALRKRIKAAIAYKKAIAAMKEAHSKLNKEVNDLDAKQVFEAVADYAKKLYPLVQEVRKAFDQSEKAGAST